MIDLRTVPLTRVLLLAFLGVSFPGPSVAGESPQEQPREAADHVAKVAAPWVNRAWAHRMSLTVDEDQIRGVSTLEGFPLLLILDDAHHAAVFQNARADGSDLLFTEGDGQTILPHELVSYSQADQTAQVWVRAKTLSPADRTFYLYYGNPSATSTTSPDVWLGYSAVYHFEEDPSGGTLRDSGPAQADAIAAVGGSGAWTSSDLVDGWIGRGWHYDGNEITHSFTVRMDTLSWSTSAWIYLDTRSTDFFLQGNPCFFHLSTQASDVSHDGQYQNGYCGAQDWRWLGRSVEINEWHHWAWVFAETDSSITLYYDGEETPITWRNPNTAQNWQPHGIGQDGKPVGVLGPMWYNALDPMNGVGDEFRLYRGTASPHWVRTEYRNQLEPLQFYVFGQEEDAVPVQTSSWSAFKNHFRQ